MYRCGKLPRTGDEGQRYELWYEHRDGESKVFGWCNRNPERLCKGMALAPYVARAWWVDRQPPAAASDEGRK